jgi:KDO2-lipid IV(A) lauroyltransferase
LAIPHTGSWDWGGSIIGSTGVPLTVVAEKLKPLALFEWFRAKRELVGMKVIGLDDDTASAVIEVLNAGGVIGLLCDRDLQGNGVPVNFFDHPVTLPAGPALFALRTNAVLLGACCYNGPGSDHFAVFTPPIPVERQGRLREDVARVTQQVGHVLEGLIQRAPEQWHVLEDRFGPKPCA